MRLTRKEIKDGLVGAFCGAIAAVFVVSIIVKTFDHFAPPSPYFRKGLP